MVKERGLVCTPESVRGYLEGRKTQTRRLLAAITGEAFIDGAGRSVFARGRYCVQFSQDGRVFHVPSPYGAPGDLLYVRETYRPVIIEDLNTGETRDGAWYKADRGSEAVGEIYGWKSALYMPKKYARLWLEITGIRVERLHSITWDDAVAEGIEPHPKFESDGFYKDYLAADIWVNAIDSYKTLWDSINAKRGYGWETNPWVWVVMTKKVERNG